MRGEKKEEKGMNGKESGEGVNLQTRVERETQHKKETYQTKKVKYSTKAKQFSTRSLIQFPHIFLTKYIKKK